MRALERAIAFCQSTLSYGRVQEPPPDRKPVALEPLVEEVRETLGARARRAGALDQRGRARARWSMPTPTSCFRVLLNLARNAAAGAGKPRAPNDPGARSGPHHRPARGRGGGDRGVRHRPGHLRARRARICSRRSRARPAPAAPGSASPSPPSWCAPMAARSAWSKAPSARPSALTIPDRAVELNARRGERTRATAPDRV